MNIFTNPILNNFEESSDNNITNFTISNIDLSIANSIRRTCLSEINVVIIETENQICNIEINTTRFHNEIIKHRLSCIPVHHLHLLGLDYDLLKKYILEVDVNNETDNIIYITTKDFKIKNTETNNYITDEELKKIFPPNQYDCYIDLIRLRPKIAHIPGERLKFTSGFNISNSKENSVYNVCNCSYGFTLDYPLINTVWEDIEKNYIDNKLQSKDIDFKKRDFYILNAQKYYINNSYDFTIETIGVYTNKYILKEACNTIKNNLINIITKVNNNILRINISENTLEYSYDIILENEDYTIGKILEYGFYDYYFEKNKILNYCGFKKIHPHDDSSIIRLSFKENIDKITIYSYIVFICQELIILYDKITDLLK